jgi:hypothetical protein
VTDSWAIKADGPDGVVEHFYADTGLTTARVVLESAYQQAVEALEEVRNMATGYEPDHACLAIIEIVDRVIGAQ